jgi:hypothetical protein
MYLLHSMYNLFLFTELANSSFLLSDTFITQGTVTPQLIFTGQQVQALAR